MIYEKTRFILTLVIVLITCNVTLLFAWGYWGHQRINRSAVFGLPDSMRTFFYNHIDYITEESTMPDVRIYAINYRDEANRHYINPELIPGYSLDNMPVTMSAAKAKYGDSLLQKIGLLPWYIDTTMTKLTVAFKDKNKPYILFLAADLAHYLGDATQPLHTTDNHDGQLTGQKGIHSFFEAQLPEKFGNTYNLNAGNAVYLTDVKKEIWQIIKDSHKLVDTLLLMEKTLRKEFPANDVYQKDATGNIFKNRYGQTKFSLAYAQRYHEALHGMVEKRIRAAMAAVSNFWYTAWVNAGSPELTSFDSPDLTKRNKKFLKRDLKLWKKGQLFGLKSANEF